MKYEHLYRLEIDDGHQLGQEIETYRQLFNQIRPHEALAMRRPLDVYLAACNDPHTTNSNEPETPANSVKRDNPNQVSASSERSTRIGFASVQRLLRHLQLLRDRAELPDPPAATAVASRSPQT